MQSLKVMVADDDKNICELLRLYLEKEKFIVSIVNDGRSVIEKFNKESFDLLILDIMMPIKDGFHVCKEVRKISSCPIIMLTAKDQVFDKVKALEIGADDYMVKPFEMKELIARIKALLRRCKDNNVKNELERIVRYDKLVVDLSTYKLVVNDKEIDTPRKQMELLYYLANNPNKVFSRDQLLDEVWGFEYFGDTRTVDVHIKRLREKLQDVSSEWELKTVWGVGYKFELVE